MLQNTGKLAGCTLFITGASRGIGKAIALKAARDGANVVIAAKTAEPHPKLPGTIYTAAEEVEAAGGKALPCVVDIRDEQQIGSAVQKAVDTFGGIDILVNNASAISLTGTLETPMKKVDLMLGINLRGTYLTSKLVIPHLLKSRSPHILNLSPPLNLNPVWFKNHTAYTMAKYGMSMCVLGMAEEFRGQIAINALWPKTAIQTAAMDMLVERAWPNSVVRQTSWRTPPTPSCPNRRTTRVTSWWTRTSSERRASRTLSRTPSIQGHPLLPDFFLDESPDVLVQQMEQHGATPAFKPPPVSSAPPLSSGPIESTFDVIRGVLSEDVVKSTQGVYRFDLSGENAGVWFLDLKNGAGSAGKGDPPLKADVVMKMDSGDFSKMFSGKLKPTLAFMSGKLQIKGDMTLAIKLEKLMGRMNKAKL
ncbi:hypothetical protein OJAV_G00124750 [Oryzias javanicus]|uniref:Hydroxysteroid dehydrogenase-like protein 2 n=1 Tax=Oryzias javanicus TaxID=123683 RepID=A0A437CTU6_ORYJA|nr:hypothetical protein OJAV_G00124750 [Oryzias javanicus]